MKVRLDPVTNSSSMCYVMDKRTLSDEELELIRENSFLEEPYFLDVTRCSSYGEGKALRKFVRFLKEDDAVWDWENPLTEWLQDYLAQIGVDNIIFVRRSDENMGGRVVHVRLITEKAVSEREYH